MQKRARIYVPMGVTETDCRAWVLLVLSEFCFSLLTTVLANLVYSSPPPPPCQLLHIYYFAEQAHLDYFFFFPSKLILSRILEFSIFLIPF